MPEIRNGTPVWISLNCQDVEAARRFYTNLFGWTFTPPEESMGGYQLIMLGEETVGGMMRSMNPDGSPADVPSAWTVFLHVRDIEAAVESAASASARVLTAPMRAGDMGALAELIDPGGAAVGLWQPGSFGGFRITGSVGTAVWFECMATDFGAALPFYRDVLEWDIAFMNDSGESPTYVTHGAGEAAVAGLCDASEWFDAPLWRIYVAVEDTDAAVGRVQDGGGRLLDGPVDSPFGRLATVADPEGATFQLIQGRSAGG
ncbi:VOC family protein [Brevibacterium daeguense]|uniref:VOC family protein n=1 Tax=Brevibacterium daeguense TaxID=909936 RepID=A0ABP8EKA1_9MICO|nr:VOC family protein [Brevibacterium daeguense]